MSGGTAEDRSWGWAVAPFSVMAVAQVALVLTDDDATVEWLSTLIVAAFALTTLLLTAAHWGFRWTVVAGGYVLIVSFAVEQVGTTTGWPFGDYEYTGALQPTVGDVPLVVPLAWLAMSIPALEVGRRISDSRLGAVAVGAIALTAWDLFLDPHMVDNGYWEWDGGGTYHGVPLSNYVGWLLVGFLVIGAVDRIRPDELAPHTGLVALYTWWTVIYTIGFIVFLGEPVVGVVGGLAMGSLTVLAWHRWALGPWGGRSIAG